MTVQTMELLVFSRSRLDVSLMPRLSQTHVPRLTTRILGCSSLACTKQWAVRILHLLLSHMESTNRKASWREQAGAMGGNSKSICCKTSLAGQRVPTSLLLGQVPQPGSRHFGESTSGSSGGTRAATPGQQQHHLPWHRMAQPWSCLFHRPIYAKPDHLTSVLENPRTRRMTLK